VAVGPRVGGIVHVAVAVAVGTRAVGVAVRHSA
jgi:hypothetical protein